MRFASLPVLVLGLLTPHLIAAQVTCDFSTAANSGDTCTSFAAEWGLTEAAFEALNPGVSCTADLVAGTNYCVIGTVATTTSSSSTSSSTTTTTAVSTTSSSTSSTISSTSSSTKSTTLITVTTATSTSTTTTGDGVSTPSPIQTGMVTDCDAFHLVASGDECGTIASTYGITLANFYLWNPAVGSTCLYLDLGDYVCVNIIGGSTTITTTTATTTTATTGDGVTTPTPIQTGMVTDCDAFHLVVSGDECSTIASTYGITLANLYLWNPAVGSTCLYLDLGDYVCVNIIGGSSTITTTVAATTTTSITTPTPIQTGMVTDCDVFHLVVSGDECGTIASTYDITLAEFYLWNPAVGSTCAYLDLGDYVCVDIIGGATATATTTSATTTTTSGNGISTPTPIQAGMVTDCDTFHFVVSGDECGTIASTYDITLAEFYLWNPAVGSTCASLDLGYYVCIGIE